MSEPQIIRTPSGEELVVLPRAEYEALLERADHEGEDADDVAIYDARNGETQLHLNFKTGIGQGYLSDLESGRRAGTPETIAKLAQALEVPVEWLS
jgi:hypothetical protein